MRENTVKNIVLAAVCLALCLVLPFLTGQIPQIGSTLCPMHIWWAMAVGAAAPLLRFALFGMPPIFPTGTAMCFELAVYGLVSGLLYARLPKKTASIYVSLIGAMLAGRIVWGVVMAVISSVTGSAFTWAAFLAGAFINAVPGIVVHILLIPVAVIALKKAGLIKT